MSLKMSCYYKFFCLVFLLIGSLTSLDAGGWGQTDEIVEYEETSWNGVYFDMNGFYFTASIPNYSGTCMQNGMVSFGGEVEEGGYVITTSLNAGFTPPKSIDRFVKMVQEANPDYIVSAVNSKAFGAKYAVDLIPLDSEQAVFWRFLSTKNRLIKMGTGDANENRRLYFLESICIH